MNRYTPHFLLLSLATAGWLLSPTTVRAAAPTNAPAAAPGAAAGKAGDPLGDAIVARGKGVEVKRAQLEKLFITRKTAAILNGQSLSPDQAAKVERGALEELIASQLLMASATDADRAKGKERFDEAIKKWKDELKVSDEEFKSQLARQLLLADLTVEQWEKDSITRFTTAVIMERELHVNITDAAARQYYDENPARFEVPEAVRVAHILIRTSNPRTGAPLPDEQQKAKRKLAEDVLRRAKAGEDFAKLVKEFSDHTATKDKGGEIALTRQMSDVPPEFPAAAFSLGTNQISDLITTPVGFDIMKFLERVTAHKLEFAKVAGDIKDALRNQELDRQLPDYLDKLKKEAGVEILDEKLKAIELPRPGTAAPASTNSAPKAAEKK